MYLVGYLYFTTNFKYNELIGALMHKDALTLEYAGGKGILPIGHFSQIILWSRKLLTLSINIPTT